MARSALITGVSGQDGWYLSQLLLSKDYKVYGMVRDLSEPNADEVATTGVELIVGDLCHVGSLEAAVETARPDEVYNLGGYSHVGKSYDEPEAATDSAGLGTMRLLEAIRHSGRPSRMYQASSSEMFGQAQTAPQDETTAFHPRSPYGVAKVYAHHMTVYYRERYGIHASCGILYNHESPRRGVDFVTRKITRAAAGIKQGHEKQLVLGDLSAKRDWGYAGDYVEGMWLMLQQDKPDDYVLATGQAHSIQDVLTVAFEVAGLGDWHPYVRQDKNLLRPAPEALLVGDPSKAKRQLGWEPKVSFEGLIKMMVEADLKTT